MLGSYTTAILSIFIRGKTEIYLPGLNTNETAHSNITGLFTGFSSETFRENLYCNKILKIQTQNEFLNNILLVT